MNRNPKATEQHRSSTGYGIYNHIQFQHTEISSHDGGKNQRFARYPNIPEWSQTAGRIKPVMQGVTGMRHVTTSNTVATMAMRIITYTESRV
jgi:hypothetical protein